MFYNFYYKYYFKDWFWISILTNYYFEIIDNDSLSFGYTEINVDSTRQDRKFELYHIQPNHLIFFYRKIISIFMDLKIKVFLEHKLCEC